jgi:hypothetical protein
MVTWNPQHIHALGLQNYMKFQEFQEFHVILADNFLKHVQEHYLGLTHHGYKDFRPMGV